jgi:poly(A) polymerase
VTRLDADWVTAPASSAVMAALDGQGYFVGGCVRNTLLGQTVPDEVVRRLEAAGLKAVPTGLHHGTITAVAKGEGIEVTTFRTDIETFGRHAVVAYTTDIREDAARRDFTMNALYADREGEVIDPLGGLPDVLARRVRFIDDPHDRIREDYLRILRFFRFHAWYGSEGIDPDGLAACSELADGLEGLARERIGWEFRKLLSAPDPAPAVAAMAATGILTRCLRGAGAAALAPLVHTEERAGRAPDWIARLAVLGAEKPVAHLRLSRAEQTALSRLRAALAEDRPEVAAYRFGREAAERASVIRAASLGADPNAEADAIERGATAKFPLAARDLLALGFTSGPELGAALKAAETRWIDSGFALDKDALLSEISPNRS